MKIDFIVREELWRSIPVYFVSFLAIGLLIPGGYLPLPLSSVFVLALIPTAAHVHVMVRYRRKGHLTDPTITNILGHAFQPDEEGKSSRVGTGKTADAVLFVAVFLIYLYACLAPEIDQVFRFIALVAIAVLAVRLVFIHKGRRRISLVRWLIFYILLSAVILLPYLISGYPGLSFPGGLLVVGIVSTVVLWAWEKRCAERGKGR